MKINLLANKLDLTPSLKIYVESKLAALSKLIMRFDADGEAELWVRVARITRHHKKGVVWRVTTDLRLPHKILRAEEESGDPRAAIDAIRDKLRIEIEKHRTRFLEIRRT